MLDDFGVAAGDRDSSSARGSCHGAHFGLENLRGQAGFEHISDDQRFGLAPETARSFTVPLTASSPMEPPGKRRGLTTKLSVVMASRVPLRSRCAASPERFCRRAEEKRREQAFDQPAAGFAAGSVSHFDLRLAEAKTGGMDRRAFWLVDVQATKLMVTIAVLRCS